MASFARELDGVSNVLGQSLKGGFDKSRGSLFNPHQASNQNQQEDQANAANGNLDTLELNPPAKTEEDKKLDLIKTLLDSGDFVLAGEWLEAILDNRTDLNFTADQATKLEELILTAKIGFEKNTFLDLDKARRAEMLKAFQDFIAEQERYEAHLRYMEWLEEQRRLEREAFARAEPQYNL